MGVNGFRLTSEEHINLVEFLELYDQPLQGFFFFYFL